MADNKNREEDVINNKGDSCGKRKEDSEDIKGGKHLRAITMMKILPKPLTFWYLKNENTEGVELEAEPSPYCHSQDQGGHLAHPQLHDTFWYG